MVWPTQQEVKQKVRAEFCTLRKFRAVDSRRLLFSTRSIGECRRSISSAVSAYSVTALDSLNCPASKI